MDIFLLNVGSHLGDVGFLVGVLGREVTENDCY